MKVKGLVVSLFAVGMMASPLAHATNGYFSHGYGMKAKGMGGAATAMAVDTFGGANNPASMVWVGDRLDVGIDWFSPKRGASRSGSAADFAEESTNNNFFIPEFGYNHMMNADMSLGVTVYGNGGMNTSYTSANSVAGPGGCGATPTNPLCVPSKLGVNLEQLVIAPTWAYKLNETNSIGISPLLGYQRFSANGLQAFAAISTAPANLTDNGHDSSTGWGVRFGWQGKMSDSLTLGAAYSTKMKMGKFDKYSGLFADQGAFDIPENFNLGVALRATDSTTIAADYQRINYGGVKSIANPSTQLGCPGTGCLGGSTGIGFGWSNVNVFKLGLMHQYNDQLTISVGFDHSDNPIQARDTTFNILAPGVVQDHYTAGVTYAIDKSSEITASYMHAMKKTVTGAPNAVYFPMGGTEEIHMYQNSLGIAYGMKF